MSKSYTNRELTFPTGRSDLLLNLSQKQNEAYDFGALVTLLQESPDLHVGEVCIARLDYGTGNIAMSLAHFQDPDASRALVAHVNSEEEKLLAKAFDLGAKADPPIFINAFAVSKITKIPEEEDLKRNIDKMGISTKAEGDKTRSPTAVLLYDDFFIQMLSKGELIEPWDFLQSALSWMEKNEITVVNDRRKNANNIPEAALNILLFGIYAVLRSKNGFDVSIGLVELVEADSDFTSDNIVTFLEGAISSCSIEGFEEEDDEVEDGNNLNFEERLKEAEQEPSLEDAGGRMRRSSFGSISPLLINKRRRTNTKDSEAKTQEMFKKAADSFTTASNSMASMTSTIQDLVATKSTSSSKDFFEKEENEFFKEQYLHLQSPDGENKSVEIKRNTVLFMKKTAANQVLALSKKHPNVKFESSMLLSLRSGVETSSGAYETPQGLSVFGISVQESYNKNAMAVQMQLLPESLVAQAYTADEIKKEWIDPEVVKISEPFHLSLVLEAYKTYLKNVAGKNSFLTKKYSEFLSTFNEKFSSKINFKFKQDGPSLLLSILQAVNTTTAAYANLCSEYILDKNLLDFKGILHSLTMETFMNTYAIKIPVAPAGVEKKSEKLTKKKKGKSSPTEPSKEITCSLTDLRLENWRQKANSKRIRSLSLTVPQIRGKPILF